MSSLSLKTATKSLLRTICGSEYQTAAAKQAQLYSVVCSGVPWTIIIWRGWQFWKIQQYAAGRLEAENIHSPTVLRKMNEDDNLCLTQVYCRLTCSQIL